MNFEANRAVRIAARKLIIQNLTPLPLCNTTGNGLPIQLFSPEQTLTTLVLVKDVGNEVTVRALISIALRQC